MGPTGRPYLSPSRVALIVLVACVAAAVATVAVLHGRRKDDAQTTVFVTRVLPVTNGSDINTSIADFETALHLPQVDDAVSHDTGVPTGTVHDGISVSRLGASSAVRVSFSGEAGSAPGVVVAAAHHALLTLAQQQIDAANEGLASAQASATSALGALNTLDQSLNTNDIDTEYARHSQNLINLENQEAVSPSAGLPSLIKSERARLAALAAVEPQYQRLKAASDSSQATLATANQALTDANGRLRAAADPTILTPAALTPSDRVPLLAQADAGAAVGAGALVALLFAGADSSARRREAAVAHAPAAAGNGAGAPEQHEHWAENGVLRAGRA